MTRTTNKSYFHYFVQYYDEDGDPYDGKYYMTLKDIMADYNVCRKTLHKKIKEPRAVFRSPRLQNIGIIRVREPRYVIVDNPHIL